jgi:hypothetical protein
VTVPGTGPKAGIVEVGGGYGAVNGTKTGAVPLGVDRRRAQRSENDQQRHPVAMTRASQDSSM